MGAQQERVAAHGEAQVELLGGAAVWVALAIKPGGEGSELGARSRR
jgi:hypothetical protein